MQSDIDIVVTQSKTLEALLEQKFGATGRGLHEKLSSIEYQLETGLVKNIRWIATMRNKVVHENFQLTNQNDFLRSCQRALEGLQNTQNTLRIVDKIQEINTVPVNSSSRNSYNTTPKRIISHSRRKTKRKSESGGFLGTIITVIIFGIIGYFVYGFIQDSLHRNELTNQPVIQETLKIANTQAVNSNPDHFQCDGRKHCSQMRSLEEARWFVRNCPDTEMDGDHDGEPCEQQF
ncbi:excalibur calcium-binding domain-containing protein [Acinetobacter modestus]|uniref:excalibur calcium-binding domain-containing protein n=1 Tax=Acinetobacter modestus TaxID=1776740 RepID=UPI001F4B73DA|nr:excalibur calcium-binding domain-containing protein [Acinetobacter modestus]MCH7387744.1 excalibur calcium-binding domain-containing protein [Acinetobacter modestus]